MALIGVSRLLALFALCGAFTDAAWADPAQVCRDAAARVARTSGVPYPVLLAITQTETGRTSNGVTEPWAWAINLGGDGRWFSSRAEAYGFAQSALAEGRRNFDVGCFQINYRWHGAQFASLDAMFDPILNGEYAARFLADLYRETGSWSQAAGAYHSRTEVYASRYRARFDAFYAAALDEDPPPAGGLVRRNSFVLLQPGDGPGGLGSLVPLPKSEGT